MAKTVALDYAPYDYQADFHSSPVRFHLIVGGRRVGKSKMALMDAVKHCLEVPGAQAWWVAPTIAMAREIGWAEFKEIEETLSPAISTTHESLLRVRFTNGSQMYFKGADNERSLRGRGLTYLILDEAAFIDPAVWTQVLFPALTDRRGKALLISTPNGRNWFYDQMLTIEGDEAWEVRHWPTYFNPRISEDDLKQSMTMISELDFRQEFLGEFITKEGMVYDDFGDENVVARDLIDLKDRYEYFLGVDFGFANPTAIGFFAVDPIHRVVVLFDEVYASRKSMSELDELIRQRLDANGLDPSYISYIYTDPAGNAEELSSGISPVDFLRRSGWHVQNKGTEIAPGLALVRSFICDANGDRHFIVTDNCREAIRSLNGYTYERKSGNTEEIKEEANKDGIHDHFCDAIRYFFVNEFEQNRWIAERPEVYDYSGVVKSHTSVMKRCQDCRKLFASYTPKNKPPHYCKDCTRS